MISGNSVGLKLLLDDMNDGILEDWYDRNCLFGNGRLDRFRFSFVSGRSSVLEIR
jgi:hypothetical protein